MSATAPAARPARSGSSASGLMPPEGGVPGRRQDETRSAGDTLTLSFVRQA